MGNRGASMSKLTESMFDSLVAPLGYDEPEQMPGDGSRAGLGMRVLLGSAVLVVCAIAACAALF
jgi:hypothetical protein